MSIASAGARAVLNPIDALDERELGIRWGIQAHDDVGTPRLLAIRNPRAGLLVRVIEVARLLARA